MLSFLIKNYRIELRYVRYFILSTRYLVFKEKMKKKKENKDLSLYIHIPFCQKKCFFCSFTVCIAKKHRIDQYIDNLKDESRKYLSKKIRTVYIGGGTPTLLNEPQLKRLFDIIYSSFQIKKNCEITIETNPDTIDQSKAELLHRLGVNRMSVGVQSFNDFYLKFLGRTHNSGDAYRVVSLLRDQGFDNINLDIMHGFPGQTMSDLKKDLQSLIKLKSDHVSMYALTIERNSQFFRKKIFLPNNNLMAKFYSLTSSCLEESGFKQYEISNFAKSKKQSEHNRAYWEGKNYIGLGLGAHSHFNGKRYWNISKLYEYMTLVNQKESIIEFQERLNSRERLMEAILFGLRMNEGVCVSKIEKRVKYKLSLEKREIIKRFVTQGFLIYEKEFLKATDKGRLVLDEISARLI